VRGGWRFVIRRMGRLAHYRWSVILVNEDQSEAWKANVESGEAAIEYVRAAIRNGFFLGYQIVTAR